MDTKEFEHMQEASGNIARSFARLSRLILIKAPTVLIENERRILLSRVEAFPCADETKELVDSMDKDREQLRMQAEKEAQALYNKAHPGEDWNKLNPTEQAHWLSEAYAYLEDSGD